MAGRRASARRRPELSQHFLRLGALAASLVKRSSVFHGGGHIWVANMHDDTVMKLSLDGHRVAVVKVGSKPAAIVPFRDDLVVINAGDQSLSRVPLESGGTGMMMME